MLIIYCLNDYNLKNIRSNDLRCQESNHHHLNKLLRLHKRLKKCLRMGEYENQLDAVVNQPKF